MNLFKSKKTREREARQARRKAFRQAERQVEDVRQQIANLEQESRKMWQQALDAKRGGEGAAAQRGLTGYRARQLLITKMEQKRWVFEQYLIRIRMGGTDQEFAAAMAAINEVVKIDPAAVEDVFAATREKLDDQLDTEDFWKDLYKEEMAESAGRIDDVIPSLEDLETQLSREAVEGIGAAPAGVDAELERQIAERREAIQKKLKEG
jgi:vacuolar-type H+-ATPase subunit E/Vma4